MSNIKHNSIKGYNDLLYSLNRYDGILTKEVIDYLYSLLKSDISVLNRNSINNDIEDILSDLKIFRDIAAFNIYYRTKKYVENFISYKFEDNIYYSNLTIYYIVNNYKDKVFSFDYDKYNNCNITLYGGKIKSVYQRSIDVKNELKQAKEELNNERIGSIKYDCIKDKIEYLKNVSYEELKYDYEKESELLEPKNLVLENALLDYGLNIDTDFKKCRDGFVRTNSFSKILIKR